MPSTISARTTERLSKRYAPQTEFSVAWRSGDCGTLAHAGVHCHGVPFRLRAVRFAVIAAGLLASVGGSAAAQTPASQSMAPSQIRTLVLNGTQRIGLAAQVSAALAKRGFAIQHLHKPWVASAPNLAHATTIYFDASQSKARIAAAVVRLR